MKKPVASLSNSTEYFNKSEWETLYSKGKVDRVIDLTARKNVFRGYPLIAVWGFSLDTKALIDFQQPQIIPIEEDDNRGTESQFLFLLNCAEIIRPHVGRNITFDVFLNALKSNADGVTERYDLEFSYLKKHSQNLKLIEVTFGNLSFLTLYDRTRRSDLPKIENDRNIELLSDFYDFYRMNSSLHDSIPRNYVLERIGGPAAGAKALFNDVRQFDPVKDSSLAFKWPWQECIVGEGNDGVFRFEYRAIETTSLVLDLRNSTLAMAYTSSPERYAEFIDGIVYCAKSIITKHGGFFDKDTGDGIVSHFCNLNDIGNIRAEREKTIRAFECAKEIIERTSVLCKDFQPELALKMKGLGGAIGLHCGSSVWLADRNQIRAIGDSVVLASRLCGNAPVEGILLSNTSFEKISQSLPRHVRDQFSTFPVAMKDHKESAQFEAHLFLVSSP